MPQLPTANRIALLPVTVQTDGVIEMKLTINPELAVAFNGTLTPTGCVAIEANVMVCVAIVTAKLSPTGGAAAY
jgi:hypothetical protein